MIKPAIVVIAYNRDKSLKRLLKSLGEAEYDICSELSEIDNANKQIPLIISIDKSDNTKVAAVANAFEWKYGEKKVILREENLGLKKHVIECGNLVNEYGYIIVLEDDLYVSKDFYSYASNALEFTDCDEKVAGISLYNHCLNVHVREPFGAMDDGYDNYYMQFAQSWGQAYSKSQWNGFIDWMKENELKPVEASNVPKNVSSWSDKSWLKYYIKYIIETDKYFIYPRESYTTNFGDEGTHAGNAVSDLQVLLAGKKHRDFCFSKLEESKSIYDAYFESMNISGNITVDLYGYKESNGKLLLTSRALPYKIVKTYGRMLRPIDANIVNEIEGNDFFLYDTEVSGEAPKLNDAGRILYNYRALNVKKMMEVIKYRIFKK